MEVDVWFCFPEKKCIFFFMALFSSLSCVSYVPEPENSALLRCALNIFRKFNRYPEALRPALMLNDVELVENIFTSCKDM